MEVKSISIHTIKPSSPTPAHLQTFKTSLLDNHLPLEYSPFISFYRKNEVVNQESLIHQLKHSLPETLTRFYPLTGRVKNDLTVDCNDQGVLFCTSKVSWSMTELLTKPKIMLFYQLAPPLPPILPESAGELAQLAIQVNTFSCGGVAICICFCHKIIDATTMACFLKCWAAIANGSRDKDLIYPDYMSGVSLFSQEGNPLLTSKTFVMTSSLMKEGKGITKRFVFDGGAISALKTKAMSQLVPNPTRVEVISAFIWKHCMEASKKVWGSRQPSILLQAINLRPRLVPPLSKYSIGNIIWNAIAYCDVTTTKEVVIGDMVGLLRNGVEKIRDEFLPKIQSDGAFSVISDSLREVREILSNEHMNPYTFTSWCKMGFNEVDFGWGKPVWVSQFGGNEVDRKYKNIVILMDGETSNEIDAWVILDQREMVVLEGDPEFVAFASPNPSISI